MTQQKPKNTRKKKSRAMLKLGSYVVVLFAGVLAWYYWINPWVTSTFIYNTPWFEVAWSVGKAFIWIAPVFIFLKWIDKEKPIQYLNFGYNLPKGLLWGVILSLVWIGISFIVEYCFKDKQYTFNIILHYWVGGALVGLFEEIPFRGYLLPKLEDHFKSFWMANIFTTLICLLSYFPKWFTSVPPGTSTDQIYQRLGVLILPVLIWSLVFGYIYKKTNNLWTVIILHSVTSLLVYLQIGFV